MLTSTWPDLDKDIWNNPSNSLLFHWFLKGFLHSVNLTFSMAICPFQRLLDLAYLTTKPKILKSLAQLETSSNLGSKKRVDSYGTYDSRHTYLFQFSYSSLNGINDRWHHQYAGTFVSDDSRRHTKHIKFFTFPH